MAARSTGLHSTLGKALEYSLSSIGRAWQLLVWMSVVSEKVQEAVGMDWRSRVGQWSKADMYAVEKHSIVNHDRLLQWEKVIGEARGCMDIWN